MGCNTSASTAVVSLIIPRQVLHIPEANDDSQKDYVHLMYCQLFKELLSQINENQRNKVIFYCPDPYTEDNLLESIAANKQLNDLTNYMREKIEDENSLFAMGCLMIEMGS